MEKLNSRISNAYLFYRKSSSLFANFSLRIKLHTEMHMWKYEYFLFKRIELKLKYKFYCRFLSIHVSHVQSPLITNLQVANELNRFCPSPKCISWMNLQTTEYRRQLTFDCDVRIGHIYCISFKWNIVLQFVICQYVKFKFH